MADDETPNVAARALDRVDASLAQVRRDVAADMELRIKENTLRDQRIRKADKASALSRRLGSIGILVGVIASAIAAVAVFQIRENEADREKRTIGACSADNARVAQLHEVVAVVLTQQGLASIETLRALVPNPDPTPERTAERLAVLSAANEANTAAAIEKANARIGFEHLDGSIYNERDCTTAGIDAYFAEQKAIEDRGPG